MASIMVCTGVECAPLINEGFMAFIALTAIKWCGVNPPNPPASKCGIKPSAAAFVTVVKVGVAVKAELDAVSFATSMGAAAAEIRKYFASSSVNGLAYGALILDVVAVAFAVVVVAAVTPPPPPPFAPGPPGPPPPLVLAPPLL